MARLPRFGISLVVGAGLVAMGLASTGAVSAASTLASGGSNYVPLSSPVRLLDTRTTNPASTLGPAGSLNLAIPAETGMSAVALNVTVTNTTAAGYLTVFPAGTTQPYVSNLNWAPGETVANSVIVAVPTAVTGTTPASDIDALTIYNSAGKTDVVVDEEGYFTTSIGEGTSVYVPLNPTRITDTRAGSGSPNAGDTLGPASGPAGTLNVQVTGEGGVPAGATGVILNVTATNTTAASYFTVYPYLATTPTASNLNWIAGETVANRVLATLSTSGAITIYNRNGNADVVVDVDGYFTNSATPANASQYFVTTPTRLLDTRLAGGTLGAGGVDSVPIVGLGGIPATASAAVLNVTATNTTAPSFFTVYPGSTRPLASDVNWTAEQTVPNLTVATLSNTGTANVYNSAGAADLVVDSFGYFGLISVQPVMVSATVVSATEIDVTYGNIPVGGHVGCNNATAGAFAYDYTTGTYGGTATGCTAPTATTLELTGPAGSFVLPTGNASLTYTPPSTTANGVSDTVGSFVQYAAAQTLQLSPVPSMVSAVVKATTIVIAYNTAVTCPASSALVAGQFSYLSSTTGTANATGTTCTTNGNALTLGAFVTAPVAPTAGATITYTAAGHAIYATGAPNDVATTPQTLTIGAVTAPVMASAAVTTTSIAITYNEAVVCPATASLGDFVYNDGTVQDATATSCSVSGLVLTLAGTFTVPTTGAPSLTYTQVNPSDTNAVYAAGNGANFEPSGDFAPAITPLPPLDMLNATVATGAGTITINYNQPVTCALPAYSLFSYVYGTGETAVTPTSCVAGTADQVVLHFAAPSAPVLGASLAYAAPGISTTLNSVYVTSSTMDFAGSQTITTISGS